MKRWLAIIPLAVLVGIVGVSLSRLTAKNPAPATFSSPARPLPPVSGQDLAGAPVSFQDVKGPYIVNVWATWCTPCRAEHPVLMKLKEQGVPVLGVLHMDSNDKSDPAAAIDRANVLLSREGDPFQIQVADPLGNISLDLGIAGVPESFIVDGGGMIVKTIRGPLIGAEGDAFLEAWQAEVKKAGG